MIYITDGDRYNHARAAKEVMNDLQIASEKEVFDFLLNFYAFKTTASTLISGEYIPKNKYLNLYSAYAGAESIREQYNDIYPDIALKISSKELKFIYGLLETKIYNQLSSQEFFSWVSDKTSEEGRRAEYDDFNKQAKLNPISFNNKVFRGFYFEEKPISSSYKPNEIWSLEDFGGNQEAKNEIYFLIKAFNNPQAYRQVGSRLPRGLLFYGPPGTGKTLAARILASQINTDFHEIKIENVLNMYVGNSEKNLARFLDCSGILFIDEFDSLGRIKGRGTNDVVDNLVNILATKLDGIEENSKNMVIAATNSLCNIDPKLTRPGRIDKIIRFNYLDKTGIVEVLRIQLLKSDKVSGRKLFTGINIDNIASKLCNYKNVSGADISEIVRRTTEAKARSLIETNVFKPYSDNDFIVVIEKYFAERRILSY